MSATDRRFLWMVAVVAGTVLGVWVQGVVAAQLAAQPHQLTLHWQPDAPPRTARVHWSRSYWSSQSADVAIPADAGDTVTTITGSRSLAGLVFVKGDSPVPIAAELDGAPLEQDSPGVFRLPGAHLRADRSGALAGIGAGSLLAVIIGGAPGLVHWIRRRVRHG